MRNERRRQRDEEQRHPEVEADVCNRFQRARSHSKGKGKRPARAFARSQPLASYESDLDDNEADGSSSHDSDEEEYPPVVDLKVRVVFKSVPSGYGRYVMLRLQQDCLLYTSPSPRD